VCFSHLESDPGVPKISTGTGRQELWPRTTEIIDINMDSVMICNELERKYVRRTFEENG
jgi:hypothetical protein